jgi:tRNA1Val (adenine37-N6)-methyltransferase
MTGPDCSEDGFLGGKLTIRQPRQGFRAGLDAVLLAAAVPAAGGEEVLELGSGAGTAALCLAWRVAGVKIRGLEVDVKLVDIAATNANINNLSVCASFHAGDALNPPEGFRRQFDHVLCNPPFHGETGETSPDPARALALSDGGKLADWLAAGLKRTRTQGSFTAILRADRLAEALAALPEGGGAVFPLWPRKDEPAKRVLLQWRVGGRTPLRLLSGLTLHAADGRYTPAADAILKGETAIPFL